MKETICAIATPPGLGAIAMIRMSGEETFAIAEKLFAGRPSITNLKPQTAKFAELYDNGQLIDQVVVTKYAAPRSYTGEDMVEITCHGSVFIQKRIVEMMVERGCRMATPGEFTQRAFLNGKMDLPQAEAIADLIDSQSETTHKLAINQLNGNFSKKINELREQFVHLASLIELELDFSEEEVEFANRDELRAILDALRAEVLRLINSFKIGNVLRSGIPVAIVGKPNVGKSTLLNTILQHDRAIVSHIPGTTRDTIEDTFVINGTLFRFIDTAGIRQSSDEIENFGIQRTYQAIEQAAVILYMIDITQATPNEVEQEIADFKAHVEMSDKQLVIIANKIDEMAEIPPAYQRWHEMGILFASAKRNVNIDSIEEQLARFVERYQVQDLSLLTNERHYALLSDISTTLDRIYEGLECQLPTDLLAEDVRAALYDLGQLTGTISTNDILNNIFGKFCIGK